MSVLGYCFTLGGDLYDVLYSGVSLCNKTNLIRYTVEPPIVDPPR